MSVTGNVAHFNETVTPRLHDDADRQSVRADQIDWALTPLTPDDRIEDLNLLLLNDDDLLEYVSHVREEVRVVRMLLAEALTMVQRQHVQGNRFKQRIHDLMGALSALRRQVRAA